MNTRNIKFTIGGPEATPGVAETMTHVIPIREKPGFREVPEKVVDPALVGINMITKEIVAARNLSGSLPLSPRPCAGFGKLINSLLGQEDDPLPVYAVVRIRYTGTEDSAKIVADPLAGELTSDIGDLGDESGDAAFGTAGVIDLTNAATDTVDELVSVIDAYTYYDAELVTGNGTMLSEGIVPIAAEQGANRWVYLYFMDEYAVVRFKYTGAQASALISCDTSANTLTSAIGALGAEAPDAAFGTAGEIDLTAVGTDTPGEIVTAIDGYDDYEAELVAGDADADAGNAISFAATQGKNTWVYLYFYSEAACVWLHRWEVDLTDTARPVYSVQGDGLHDNFLGTGVGVDQMTISGAMKAVIEAEATAMGFAWTEGQVASALSLDEVDPFLFYAGTFTVDGVSHPFIRNISIEISNNGNADGFGMGSISRLYHEKGEFSVSASFQVRYSADAYDLYAKVFNNARAALDVYFKTPSLLNGDSYGLMVIELPYCNVDDYEPQDNNGALDASVKLKAVRPVGSYTYDSPFRISMLTLDSAAY